LIVVAMKVLNGCPANGQSQECRYNWNNNLFLHLHTSTTGYDFGNAQTTTLNFVT
jgi:hypothetical protein